MSFIFVVPIENIILPIFFFNNHCKKKESYLLRHMKKNLNSARLISSILPNVLKPVTKKFTSKLFEIKAYWREIFEEDITSNCVPTKFYRINNKNILEITIISNNALEISYFSCKKL